MSDTVIKVGNLSKSAPKGGCPLGAIRHQTGAPGGHPYTALRDVLANGVRSVAGSVWRGARPKGSREFTTRYPRGPLGRATTEEFWALNDVSFEVKQGAPKGPLSKQASTGLSTRLKILSRIPSPTKGRVHSMGRAFGEPGAPGARAVASLLEVPAFGRGFHPELTGRESIYLNGAILGMSRSAIRRQVDEIVAFAPKKRG